MKLEQKTFKSPNLDDLDLNYFHSLQKRALRNKHGKIVSEIVASMKTKLDECPPTRPKIGSLF